MDKLVKVAIVGAGVSGLKAAETLISSGKIGKDEIVVLEAQDHVGGRIQDSSIGQSKLEVAYALGAMWYHDSLVNSVLYELLESGLLKDDDVYYDDKDGPTYTSDGLLDMSGLQINRVMEEAGQFYSCISNLIGRMHRVMKLLRNTSTHTCIFLRKNKISTYEEQ